MPIKVYCDFCGKEDKGVDFRCQISIAEVITDLREGFPQKKQSKKDLYVCPKCYKKYIEPKIYVEKKGK